MFRILLVLTSVYSFNIGLSQPKFYDLLSIKGMSRQKVVEFMVGKGVLDIQKSSVDTLVYKTLIDESRFEIVFKQNDKRKVHEFAYYSQNNEYYADLQKYLIERGLESSVNPSGWEEFTFCQYVESPSEKQERRLFEKCENSLYLFEQKKGETDVFMILYSDRSAHSRR